MHTGHGMVDTGHVMADRNAPKGPESSADAP